jgi:hypothetical protein
MMDSMLDQGSSLNMDIDAKRRIPHVLIDGLNAPFMGTPFMVAPSIEQYRLAGLSSSLSVPATLASAALPRNRGKR